MDRSRSFRIVIQSYRKGAAIIMIRTPHGMRRAALALGVSALALAGCAATGDDPAPANETGTVGASESRSVRIGIIPFQDFYPFLFAEDKGWFDELGIAVSFEHFDGFADSTQGLAAGAVDLAPQEVGTLLASANNYSDAVFTVPVHVFDNGFAIMIRDDGALLPYEQIFAEVGDEAKALRQTAAQLRGKTVVTTADSDMEIGVFAAVATGGLDWSDVEVIDMEANEGLAAFLSGTGDAYIGGIPHRLRALDEGYLELLTGGQMGPGSVPLVGLAAERTAVEDPATYQLYLDVFSVWNRINRYGAESEEQLLELGQFVADELNKTTGAQMVAEDFKTMFNGWQQFPPTGVAWQESYETYKPSERWETAAEFFVDVKGTVASAPPFEEHVIVDQFVADYIEAFGTDK